MCHRDFQVLPNAHCLAWVEKNDTTNEQLVDGTLWRSKFIYMWCIWKARNEWVFNGGATSPQMFAEYSKKLEEAAKSLTKEKIILGKDGWVGWLPPR